MRIWLIENYAPRFKENGGGAVNASNTIEYTLKLPVMRNVSRISY